MLKHACTLSFKNNNAKAPQMQENTNRFYIFFSQKKPTEITCGAHTELIGIGPEVINLLILIRQKWHLPLRNISWPIQPDIVKVHLTRAAGRRHITFRAAP